MCGIVGKLTTSTPEEVLNILKEGFEALEHRGEDSYGVALYTQGKLIYAKALYLDEFLEELEKLLKKEEAKTVDWFIGHNRKKSTGTIEIDTAHPVWDEKTGLAVIQNGTKKEFYTILTEAKSDTHGILLFAREVGTDFMKKLLDGAGVVFIIDHKNKKVLFHRDTSRTLFMLKGQKIIASEPFRSGKWALIKEQDRVFGIESIRPKTGDWKELKVEKSSIRRYCRTCETSKKIESKNDDRCPTCVYLGKEARVHHTSYASSYSWR